MKSARTREMRRPHALNRLLLVLDLPARLLQLPEQQGPHLAHRLFYGIPDLVQYPFLLLLCRRVLAVFRGADGEELTGPRLEHELALLVVAHGHFVSALWCLDGEHREPAEVKTMESLKKNDIRLPWTPRWMWVD